ncbi:hypothetical protein [Polyangium aurulentum]|uniref:hypothetical protein n=1 Tax=Polyangium aurulentum TaxID=2567896 RepID=UPI0010AEA3CD|nr:hypothetical protein [Polyangium aurulentum]UQA58750.1 hypothetical protein E8A73_047250 [Polyangium aurulentum]
MLALAVTHLVGVSLGALEVRLPDVSPLERAFAQYAALTGADSSYSFFAPIVGTQLRMIFEVTDHAGRTIEEPFQLSDNREILLRISNVVALFWLEDDDLRRNLSASLAGKVLATHPEAKSAAVRLDVLQMPTMAAYREGNRPSWALHYRATFAPRVKLGVRKEVEK